MLILLMLENHMIYGTSGYYNEYKIKVNKNLIVL